MPCRDPQDDPKYIERELDKRTSQLCQLVRIMEQQGLEHLIPIGIKGWSVKHKSFDKQEGR